MDELVEFIKTYMKEAYYQINTHHNCILGSYLYGKAEALADELWRNYSEDIMTYFPEYAEKAVILDFELFSE